MRVVFADLTAGAATSDPLVVFQRADEPARSDHGEHIPPERDEPHVYAAQRGAGSPRAAAVPVALSHDRELSGSKAVDGGAAQGKYSPFYRCGYSADQPNGVGNMNGDAASQTAPDTRSDCEQRGMFTIDAAGRTTARFGGIEYVPPTILVRGSGQKNYSLSAVQDNQARYNDFVPLVYGTQWHAPDVVFSRNDGNLTRMEVLLGMGEIQGVLKVLVNDIEIPQGVYGVEHDLHRLVQHRSAGHAQRAAGSELHRRARQCAGRSVWQHGVSFRCGAEPHQRWHQRSRRFRC